MLAEYFHNVKPLSILVELETLNEYLVVRIRYEQWLQSIELVETKTLHVRIIKFSEFDSSAWSLRDPKPRYDLVQDFKPLAERPLEFIHELQSRRQQLKLSADKRRRSKGDDTSGEDYEPLDDGSSSDKPKPVRASRAKRGTVGVAKVSKTEAARLAMLNELQKKGLL